MTQGKGQKSSGREREKERQKKRKTNGRGNGMERRFTASRPEGKRRKKGGFYDCP